MSVQVSTPETYTLPLWLEPELVGPELPRCVECGETESTLTEAPHWAAGACGAGSIAPGASSM